MMVHDAHTGFIAFAYAVTAMVIFGLVVRAVLDHRAQARALAELEGRGLARRPGSPRPKVHAGLTPKTVRED